MKKFKQLDWSSNRQIDCINADTCGLDFKYLILAQLNKKIIFVIVHSLYEYLPEFSQICSSIKIAKEKATKHSYSTL